MTEKNNFGLSFSRMLTSQNVRMLVYQSLYPVNLKIRRRNFPERLILEPCIDFIWQRTPILVYYLPSECHSRHL